MKFNTDKNSNVLSFSKFFFQKALCHSVAGVTCVLFFLPLSMLCAETIKYSIAEGEWDRFQITKVYCDNETDYAPTFTAGYIFQRDEDDTFELGDGQEAIRVTGNVEGARYNNSESPVEFDDQSTGVIQFTVSSVQPPDNAAGTYTRCSADGLCYSCAFTMDIYGVEANPPETPEPVFPEDQATNVSMVSTLEINDPGEEDTFLQAQWQISDSEGFSYIVLSQSTGRDIFDLQIPFSLLAEGTTYFWRARFTDNRGEVSPWSQAFSFTTERIFADSDGNGIPDVIEDQRADLNDDGIPDIQQTDEIKTFLTIDGTGLLGVSAAVSTEGVDIRNVDAIDPDTISYDLRPETMPLGLMTYNITVLNPGDTVHVKIYFSEAAPENASWYVYHPVTGWIDYSDYAQFSTDRKSAVIEITDGGEADADGEANGIIVDPCGFGIGSWFKGAVFDAITGSQISPAEVTLTELGYTLYPLPDGSFISSVLPGTYDVSVSADGYQTQSFSNIDIPLAQTVEQNVALTGRCKIKGMEVTGTPSAGSSVKLTSLAESGSDISYRFSINQGYGTSDYDENGWVRMTDAEYITDNSCGYLFDSRGKDIVVIWATSADTADVDNVNVPIIGWSVDTGDTGCKIHFSRVEITGEQVVDEPVGFAVTAENTCANTNYYRFSMCRNYGTDSYDPTLWESMTASEWVTSNAIEYTFTEAGKYIVVVWVADDTSNVDPNDVAIIGWSVDIE